MGLPLFGTLPFRSDAVIDTVLNYCFPALGMSLELKPTHASVKAYYETLHQFGQLHIDHESAVRGAFQTLLTKCGQRTEPKLTLVPEYRIKRARGSSVILDGALVDLYKLPHGYWEAKDERDDLAREVECKLDKGYPTDNTIFQAPERAILYQGGTRIFDENIARPETLVSVVNQFFEYKAPNIEEWLKAVDESRNACLSSRSRSKASSRRSDGGIHHFAMSSMITTRSPARPSISVFLKKLSSGCSCSTCSPSVSSGQFRSHYADPIYYQVGHLPLFLRCPAPSSTGSDTRLICAVNCRASHSLATFPRLVILRRRLLAPKDLCSPPAASELPTTP